MAETENAEMFVEDSEVSLSGMDDDSVSGGDEGSEMSSEVVDNPESGTEVGSSKIGTDESELSEY